MIAERESSHFEVVRWQSENRRDSVNASIAGGSPQMRICLPHHWLGENPVNPLAY